MASITNVKVGVCSVTYNGLDLGHTKGGIEVTYTPKHMDVSVDKYGSTVVEKYLTGELFQAKCPLAEYTIANIRNAMPQTEFAGAANARVTMGHVAGQSAKARSYQLVLHPISEGTQAFDIVMYKAYVASAIKLDHMVDKERIIEVMFEALLDETKADGNYLGLIGDSTK